MKTTLVNFVKVFIMLIIAVLFILLCSILPATDLAKSNLQLIAYAIITNMVLLTTAGITGHMYGAAVLSFIIPVIGYFKIPMVSPFFIAVMIAANFIMVLVFSLALQKNNWLCRGIGVAAGAVVKYGVLWVVCEKIAIPQVELIMMFKNVTDEAGLAAGATQIHYEFVEGQFIAAIIGAALAYGLIPLVLMFAPANPKV